LEGFSYVLQIDMHFICTPMWTKFYSCKKWVLQSNMTLNHGKMSQELTQERGQLDDISLRF
jgi:hypothetical protein